ncbi:MAG: hypothetical protein JNM76_08755 [Betaproteobacteria bacterium]|nr:hypothetical protein [Betaproteobacteria bacterium]
MKAIQLFIACAMLIITAGCATPRSVADIAATTLRGAWNVEIDTGRGTTLGSMIISRDVAGQEGTLTTNRGSNVLPVRTLTLNDRAIDLSVQSPNGMVVFKGELSRDGNAFEGKVTYHDGQVFRMKGMREVPRVVVAFPLPMRTLANIRNA